MNLANYITSAQAAAQLGIGQRRMRLLCNHGRVPGAILVAGMWLLPRRFHVTPGRRGPKMQHQ